LQREALQMHVATTLLSARETNVSAGRPILPGNPARTSDVGRQTALTAPRNPPSRPAERPTVSSPCRPDRATLPNSARSTAAHTAPAVPPRRPPPCRPSGCWHYPPNRAPAPCCAPTS